MVRLAETGDLVTAAETPAQAVEAVRRGQVVICPSRDFAASVLRGLGLTEQAVVERFRIAYGAASRGELDPEGELDVHVGTSADSLSEGNAERLIDEVADMKSGIETASEGHDHAATPNPVVLARPANWTHMSREERVAWSQQFLQRVRDGEA